MDALPKELRAEIASWLPKGDLKTLCMVASEPRKSAIAFLFNTVTIKVVYVDNPMAKEYFLERMSGLANSEEIRNAINTLRIDGNSAFLPNHYTYSSQEQLDDAIAIVGVYTRLLPAFSNVRAFEMINLDMTSPFLSAIRSLPHLKNITVLGCVVAKEEPELPAEPLSTPASVTVRFVDGLNHPTNVLVRQLHDMKRIMPMFLSSDTTVLRLDFSNMYVTHLPNQNDMYINLCRAVIDLPNLKILTVHAMTFLKDLFAMLRRFSSIEQLSITIGSNPVHLEGAEFDVLPNLKYYSGPYPSVLPLTEGRSMRHIGIEGEIGSIFFAGGGKDLVSLEVAWRSHIPQNWDTRIVGGLGDCETLRALSFGKLSESNLHAILKNYRLPPNLEMLWFSISVYRSSRDSPTKASKGGLALRKQHQSHFDSLSQLKSLRYVSFEVTDVASNILYIWRWNPMRKEVISFDITIDEWRNRELRAGAF